MNLLEFQGKGFLRDHGIPVPENQLIRDPGQLSTLTYPLVLKSQVLTGGRGKNGGILPADTIGEAVERYNELKTKPIRGFIPFGVMAESRVEIQREFYFGITVNRAKKCVTMMFSRQGGVNIEELPHGAISRVDINPVLGLQSYHFISLFRGADLSAEVRGAIEALALRLMELYGSFGLELLEINPLVLTQGGDVMALDAKLTIDESCVDRVLHHSPPLPDVPGARVENPVESVSRRLGVNGVRLDGDIAVITSGAGLGMATIDTLKAHGCSAHSFVDMGALVYNPEAMAEIIGAILAEAPKVFLCNFFFQVASCRVFAEAITRAVRQAGARLPIVVRARGQELEAGREILGQVTRDVYADFGEACKRAAALAGGG